MNQQIWTRYKLEDNQLHKWQLGDIQLQVSKVGKTITILKERVDEESPEYLYTTEDTEIDLEGGTKFITDRSQLYMMPAMPVYPIVFKPQDELKIAPGIQSTIYFQVPVYIQFYLGTVKEENRLIEFPSVEMSQTWFGEPDNGELALSGDRSILFTYRPEELKTNHVICPVKLFNDSKEILDFQRFLLRVEHLTLYAEKSYLCSNETRITFRGPDVASDVQPIKSKPTFSQHFKMLANPRSSDNRNLLKRSFHFLKSFTQ
ncbi:MAG: DUF432 domain-containing protein [Bacteroidetes bacterium]|jgi:hypothetical protein|nr:DUF432 domain-containing protein [Bacteroidota bacterium]